MTPDLDRLRQARAALPDLDRLELELVDDPRWGAPSDTSYLRPEELANPDIAANVAAMAATNALIAWFGRSEDGFLGLWRGPAGLPLETAPVVRLDSEGQYSLVARTVPDALAIAFHDFEGDARYQAARAALVTAGFEVAATPEAVFASLEGFEPRPNEHRNALYEAGRAKRGLGPVGGPAPEPKKRAVKKKTPPRKPAKKKAAKKTPPAPAKKKAAKKTPPARKPAKKKAAKKKRS